MFVGNSSQISTKARPVPTDRIQTDIPPICFIGRISSAICRNKFLTEAGNGKNFWRNSDDVLFRYSDDTWLRRNFRETYIRGSPWKISDGHCSSEISDGTCFVWILYYFSISNTLFILSLINVYFRNMFYKSIKIEIKNNIIRESFT